MGLRNWLEPEGVRFLQCYNASSRAARTMEVCYEVGAGFRLLVESGVSFGLEILLHFAMSAFSVSFFAAARTFSECSMMQLKTKAARHKFGCRIIQRRGCGRTETWVKEW